MPSDSSVSLSALQRRLLDQRLRERAAASATSATSTLAPAPRDQPLPLSFGQERLWLLHHLEPGNPAYNSTYLYQLRGPLDFGALESALNEVVRRHESLRTTISVQDGDAHQIVHDFPSHALPCISVATVAEARHMAHEAAGIPFDLSCDRLFRPVLFRLSAHEHILLVVAHHSAWDAWSTQVFWRELSALYAAFHDGQPSPLAALTIQYADYTAWQRRRLHGETLDRLLAFWRTQLGDPIPAGLDLPGDRARPAELSYAGSVLEFPWPVDLRDALHSLARAEGATLFMVLLAGWNTLLHRLSGEDTIVTGTAIAGRTRREFESLIGFFVNTLALRTECAGTTSFRALLQQVRTTTLAAYDHDELPFEKLVADLRVPRDPARQPIFQTALVLHSAPPPAPALAGLEISTLRPETTHARFDLALTMTENADGLRGALEYSTDLFEVATVQRWIGHLETLLRAAVARPDTALDAIPLLTTVERDHLLGPWAGAATDYPREATVHALFAEHARRTPDAVALIEGNNRLTYANLDNRANQLSKHLIAAAVTPGSFVAIELERSIGFVVAVLAVLKCGAAYVPLLRDLPAARREFIFADTTAVALITAGAPVGAVPRSVRLIDLAGLPQDGPVAPAAGHAGAATDAAYVMYTSGSTGQPKGVVLPHRGIVRLVHGKTPPPFAPGQRFLLLASTAFDASTFELWAPLLNGATLVIFPDRWPEFDPLARVVREHAITHLFLTAGLFNQVVEHRPDMLAGVTHVFTGGEAMSARHAMRLREQWPELRVTNCYGPTEVTTYTISHQLTPDEIWPDGNVPIGRSAPNARVYVLDPRGEPTPIGVPGELFLGGDGLALGYLNRPDLTAERFTPDPFSPLPGARHYRTGDRARWRPDGTVEFLGRFDDQVKLRGFRIEPAEIETVLKQHPAVRDAAVIAREDRPGDLCLVGYAVAHDDAALTAATLRDHLGNQLPDYMVPAAFVFLPALPLTANGKLDRRALPAPDLATPTQTSAITAPRTRTEAAVAAVWCAVLRRDDVGTQEDFFTLGGHSLLAMQATARLGAALGHTVPLRWWFDYPTIATLAQRIDREQADSIAAAPITPIARDGELPLSHEEQRLWFLQHVLPDPATYHVVWGERLVGPLDLERLKVALGRVMARHEILRTGYAERDGRPVRVITPACAVPLSFEDWERPAGPSGDLVLQRHLAAWVRQPFELSQAPLWRAACVRLSQDDHLLTFAAHHLICDEWSLPLWHTELLTAYAAPAETLPVLGVQYADYAAWQRQRVATPGAMSRAREFWRDHLSEAPARLALPTRRSRSFIATGAGKRVFFPLERAAVDRLEAFGRAENATPFMTWLALHAGLLARWTEQLDFVIGTPLAQRNRAELQPLIGFFLNTLPLRLRPTPGISFRALLRHVREVVLNAFAHGELPLDEIAAHHAGGRTTAGGALFSVMFVVHDVGAEPRAWPGLRTQPLELSTGTAKADLTLFIDRRPGREPRGSFEYASDTLDDSTLEWLIWELQQTLDAAATNPDTIMLDPGMVAKPAPADPSTMSATSAPATGPASEVERELTAIWRRVLRRDAVGVHDNFFSVGGHSLLALQLVHEIRQHFGRSVSLAHLLASPTIAELAALLGAEPAATHQSARFAWKGSGQGTPYFHVPGMNGVEFLPPAVAELLSPDRRWFDGLHHPGVDGNEPPATSLPLIASELVRQIRTLQPRGPYALGGFCHGGLVAYEVARQLETDGEIVRGVVLWDTFPHCCWRRRNPLEILGVLQQRLFSPGAGTFFADRARFARHLLALGCQMFWHHVRAWLPGARGRTAARMINAGMHARRRYTPMALRAPVLLVRSRDERVFLEKLPGDGWADALHGPVELVDLPHWHFHLLREPALNKLAKSTAEFLRHMDRK